MHLKTTGARSGQRGAGLIEILIAIVVVALGVLAISRMQTGMISANNSALLRSQATLLVYDMTDRLRADRLNALAEAYDRDFDQGIPGGGTTPAEETAEWLRRVGEYLPGGEGAIDATGNRVMVAVRWTDGDDPNAPAVFETVAEL